MRPSITAYGNGADRRTATLRQMTADQLLDLGTSRVAYLRSGMWDGERLFALTWARFHLRPLMRSAAKASKLA